MFTYPILMVIGINPWPYDEEESHKNVQIMEKTREHVKQQMFLNAILVVGPLHGYNRFRKQSK